MKTIKEPLSRFELALILLVAAVPRLSGLGHVSMWLDEILGTMMAAHELAEAWEAWIDNSVHPPLFDLLQWVWFRLVDSEPLRRLLPVTFGVSTVGLLAWLTGKWFGRHAAWATALIAAFSPLHVRYSQELRPYSLGLLALILALAANERALERKSWGGWAILALALALCYWSLYLTAIVLLPIAVTTLQAIAGRSRWRRGLTGFGGAVLLSAVLFSPWFSILERGVSRDHERQATQWDRSQLTGTWQFLTVGGVEGSALSSGALLFAALLVAGIATAAGSSRGRSMIAGACAGSIGVGVLLQLADHWSSGRYYLVSWPFLAILAGLGCTATHDLVIRLRQALCGALRRGGQLIGGAVAALPLVALLLFEIVGLADYYRRGRPDWLSVARTVSAMAAPDRPIMVSNGWTRLSLGYYLSWLEGSRRADVSARPRIVDSNVEPSELSPGGGQVEGCSVVVDSWRPKPKAVRELLLSTPAQREFPRSGARVAAGAMADPWSCLPEAVEQAAGERPSPRFLSLFESRRGRLRGLEFTAEDQPYLRYGWSYPERTAGGLTFRWAVGRWAAIDLPAGPASTLRLEVWALDAGQIMSVYRHRQLLASYPLSTTRQTLEVPLPGVPPEGDKRGLGAAGDEIVVFGFSRYAGPEENPRPLAVGFDRATLLPFPELPNRSERPEDRYQQGRQQEDRQTDRQADPEVVGEDVTAGTVDQGVGLIADR